MRALPRVLFFACFAGLAVVGALAFNRVADPSIATSLTRAAFLAAACAAPGLIYRKLWPLAIVLIPIGCYLLIRTVVPLPALVDGASGQYHFYVDQLYEGALFYKSALFPLPVSESPGLELLLAFIVYWLTAVAGFVALTLRKPLPAIVLILALVSYSLTVDTSTRMLWPSLLFLVLAACLLALSRSLERSGWRMREIVLGGMAGAVASALALVLLTAAPSVVAEPWRDWRAWDPFNQGKSVYTFNWLQNYPDLLNPANDEVVMRVESTHPSYWRANALDSFTGTAWVASQARYSRIAAQVDGTTYVYSIPRTQPTPAGPTVTETFSIQDVSTYYLFVGGDPLSLTANRDIALNVNEMRALRVSTALGPSLRYSVSATIPLLSPRDLVGLGSNYPSSLDAYLALPFDSAGELEGPDKEASWRATVPASGAAGFEWAELYALNAGIVREATDPYQIALRIERYLRQFYSYSLQPPESEYSSQYAAFLFDTRSGYCQHFAGAMALLLRFNGIPARVAVGFTSGEVESPGVYLVSRNNAHAWVEAYFPTIGWVAFDPTPGRSVPTAGASSTSPGFVNPFADIDTSGGGAVVTEPPRDNIPDAGAGDEIDRQREGQGWWQRAVWLPWVVGVLMLVLGWPAARTLWKHRRLHHGSWEERLQASLLMLRADLADFGAPATPAQTLEEMLDAVRSHTGLAVEPRFVARADAVLFGGRQASEIDLQSAETLRREVKRRLRKRHGCLRTTLALYGVPPRITREPGVRPAGAARRTPGIQ